MMRSLLTLCILMSAPVVVSAVFWGGSQYGHFGAVQGCSWGSQPVAVPGQCNAFQCLSALGFGANYAMQCPIGTMFSARQGRCVSPLSMAAQCTSLSGSQQSNFWYWL